MELHAKADGYENRVYVLSKALDEQVARLHLDHLGVRLSELTDAQAAYFGIPKGGPLQARHLPVTELGHRAVAGADWDLRG